MAITVPRVNQQAVGTAVVGQPRATQIDVSSGLQGFAQTAEQSASQLMQVAMERKTEDDDAAALEAYNNAMQGANVVFDGENGLMRKKGKDSFTGINDATDYLNRSKTEVSKLLANESQVKKFNALFDKSNAIRMASLSDHIERERESYIQNTYDATITDEYNRAMSDPLNAEQIEDGLFNAEIAVRQKYKGQSEKVIRSKISKLEEGVNAGVLEQLIETDVEAAKAYLKKNSKKLKADDRTRLEANLNKKIQFDSAFENSDEIIARSENEDQAMQESQKIEDNEVRQLTEQRIRTYYADERRQKSEAEEIRVNQLWNDVQDEVNNILEAPSYPRINLERMVANEQNASVRSSLRQYVTKKLSGEVIKSDVDTLSNLQAMSLTMQTPQEMKAFKDYIDSHKHLLSDQDRLDYEKAYYEAKKGNGKPLTNIVSESTQFNSILMSKPFMVKSKKLIPELVDKARTEYQIEKQQFKDKNGREPDFEERGRIMRRLTTRFSIESGSWFVGNDDKTVFEMSDDELLNLKKEDLDYGDMSSADRKMIVDYLKSTNKPETQQNINDIYFQYIKNSRNVKAKN